MPPEIMKIVRQWQTKRPHAGAKRPLSGMAARGMLRMQRYEDALGLFGAAQRPRGRPRIHSTREV